MVGHESAPRKRHKRRQITPGTPPGTLVRAANANPSRIVLRSFTADSLRETSLEAGSELLKQRDPERCLWVDVTGLADTNAIAEIGRSFGLHALSLEDVLDPAQRGKVEHYDGYTFVVLKTLSLDGQLEASQLSIFFGEGFLVTLQDHEQAALTSLRERLRQGRGKLRARAADYLAYALIDTVVDMYFPVIEAFDDHLEHVEEAVLEARGADPIDLARKARQSLRTIRHAVWQTRDVIASLQRDDMTLLSDETR